MLLVVRDEADVVDAQIAFHLNAGVNFVIATDHASSDGTTDVLESYARAGYLRRLAEHGDAHDAAWRASMARLAVDEYGADWVIDSEPDEFWLPHAESITDVLVAIPPRYGVVQALVRVFLPRPDDGRFFADRMTVRGTLSDLRGGESMGRLEWALRPIHRASRDMLVGVSRDEMLDGRVPLRAWYPVEVLRFPVRDLEQARKRVAGRAGPSDARSRTEVELFAAAQRGELDEHWAQLVVEDESVASDIADGSLVVDERLRDALHRLEQASSSEGGSARRFALPGDMTSHLGLAAPTVVDDVAYAGECAAVREVDFEPLRARMAELEERVATLEARLWPRVRRRLYRLLGR